MADKLIITFYKTIKNAKKSDRTNKLIVRAEHFILLHLLQILSFSSKENHSKEGPFIT